MDKFKMLSGEQLVTLGAKKASVTLPELGLKEVFPNGSWLEQKQVQNALEARKHLVEVERIEKIGSISCAEWREDLKLAEVTQQCGGHWQYLGHNIGKTLYIKPEEALLLMESNSLLLTHNGVTVSIQQAYSLLLGDSISLVQYKVYASLARLGYKVFRYNKSLVSNMRKDDVTASDSTDKEKASKLKNDGNHLNKDTIQENDAIEDREPISEPIDDGRVLDNKEIFQNNNANKNDINKSVHNKHENVVIDKENKDDTKQNENVPMEMEHTNFNADVEVSSSMNVCHEDIETANGDIKTVDMDSCNTGSAAFIQHKLQALYSRELRPCNSKLVHRSFDENVPDLFQKHIVTVKAPEEQFIPKNVFLNNTAYVLNLENLRLKKVIPVPSSSSDNYSTSDDVNGQHVKRIRSSLSNESAQNNSSAQFFPRFPQQTNHFRQFNYWNNYNLNFAFQRQFYQRQFFQRQFFPRQFFQSLPRFQVFPRVQQFFRCFPTPPVFMPNVVNPEIGRQRKRKRDNPRVHHLKSIKSLAVKLKNLVNMGNTQVENIQALHRLIQTYNQRYKAKLELTQELDVLENELILETIDLDDDDQTSSKKKRRCDEDDSFNDNFSALKQFALKIKELEEKNESSPQHRRALSKAIKTFNKSYNADIYVDKNYEVINRRHIVIASSSDSEGAVEVAPKPRRSKKLRNPFYILKKLSEKQNASTVQQDFVKSCCSSGSDSITKKHFKYSEVLTSNVSKDWLPSEDDFGRAEVIQNKLNYNYYLNHSEQFLYEFVKSNLHDNWLDAKISYWQSCEKTAKKFEANTQNQSTFNLDSIVRPEDCTDLPSVLKKLNIIRNNKDVKEECSFGIDFDVYNRDVPNFKKTNIPKPHFRVICIEESSKFPTALDFATHQHNYTDDVNIVFAVVGTASISYLQINANELPVYMPTGNAS